MVYAQLAENKNFAMMSDKAQKTFIFLIVLGDDDGRVKGDSEWLRIKIFPYDTSVTVADMKLFLKEIVKANLITWYKVKNSYFIQHPNWLKFQILRTDRKKDSHIPPPYDNQVSTMRGRKISKVSKRREEKENITSSMEYLKNIPIEDLFEFYKRFDCTKKSLISKGEDLYLWCQSNGKQKRNYKATLLNALKKDFRERKEDDKIRNSTLIEQDGKKKILPAGMKVEVENLADKMKIKDEGK